MITCKEDLYGTVIEIKSSEDADFVAKLCAKFGIELGCWSGCKFNEGSACAKISHNNGPHGGYLVFSSSIKGRVGDMPEFKDLKKLTLSDLKPRTKAEYEKLDESNFNVWDLKPLLENGELYSKKSNGEYTLYSANAPTYMLMHFNEYGVYRKVERSVEWFDDLSDFINSDSVTGKANYENGKLIIGASFTHEQLCDLARIALEQEDENKNNASS